MTRLKVCLNALCYIPARMLIRDDENPYLRGKTPKRHISAFYSEVKNPFEGLSETQRSRVAAEIAQAHAENFSTSLHRLKEICRSYNFFQLLAHFGYYDQLVLDGQKNDSRYKPIEQSGAELLQALILQVAEDDLRLQLESPPPPEILLEANKLLGGLFESFSMKRYASSTRENKGVSLLSELIRAHTAGVRNEGFPSQIRRTMIELVTPLDSEFGDRRKLKLTCLATMLWKIAELIGNRLSDDFQLRMRVLRSKNEDEMMSKFLQHHGSDKDTAEVFRMEVKQARMTLRDLRGYLVNLWDTRNFKLFKLSLGDLLSTYPGQVDASHLKWALSLWTIPLGGLTGTDPEHFLLNNPVWSKPIIQFGPNHFLLAIPGLVQSFGLQCLESLIQTEVDLWEKYHSRIRPKFLESFVARLFRSALPSATVLAGIHWKEPTSGQLFETDLLVVIDTHALIVECKAGRITARARRGEIIRLEKAIGKLIEEPTLQGQRFSALLSRTTGSLEVEDSSGSRHVVEAGRLLRISRINVTLDYLGPFGIQARLLREEGLVSKELEPAATLHIHELENVAEILDRPAPLFHYLHRRAEIESTNNLLTDELSLLVMYLATGFDLGDLEGTESQSLAIPTMDKELEPYFMGKELNRPASKPKRRLSGWWNDILSALELRETLGWMECSYGLLSVGYERQKEFERGVKKMLKDVKSNWHDPSHQNGCFLVAGAPKRRVKVMCVGVKNVTISEQREIVMRAVNAANLKEPTAATLALVKSASTKTYPYSAVYFMKDDAYSTL